MKTLRIYVDTSVFGGCFDKQFEHESRQLFAEIRRGRFTLILSATTLRELEDAPTCVRQVVGNIPAGLVEYIALSAAVTVLRDAYLRAGVLGPASVRDAEHIAAATVAGADLVVSWNFKHIVHFEKIEGFNQVNGRCGYQALRIHSPKEVIGL